VDLMPAGSVEFMVAKFAVAKFTGDCRRVLWLRLL
jgi:hypothetical protein